MDNTLPIGGALREPKTNLPLGLLSIVTSVNEVPGQIEQEIN